MIDKPNYGIRNRNERRRKKNVLKIYLIISVVRKSLEYCLWCQFYTSSKQKALLLIESDWRFIFIMTLLGVKCWKMLKFTKLHFEINQSIYYLTTTMGFFLDCESNFIAETLFYYCCCQSLLLANQINRDKNLFIQIEWDNQN